MENRKEYLMTLLATKNIENTVESHKLDHITRKILTFLALYQNSSTNDCYMYLNDTRNAPIPYEDVDLRIQNLIDLELIQKVKNVEKKSNENSIEEEAGSPITREKSKQPEYIKYYSTSSAGIFYLFATDPESIDIGLVIENKEDGLFVNFLYPCLEFETVDKLRDTRTIRHFKRFLGKCCKTIQKVLEDLRVIQKNKGLSDFIGFVHSLANREQDDGFYGPRRLILSLKNILNIEWLDMDETKIVEIEKNKLFKIYDDEEKENELFLEICPERNVAVLLDNKNHKIREFYLDKTPYPDDYSIKYFTAITVEDYIDKLFANEYFYYYPEIDEYESELCEELLIHMHSTYPIMNNEDRMEQRQDYIAIAKDETFQGLVRSFKYKIDSCHDNFIRLSQAS